MIMNLGEKLEREEVDMLIKECCDEEDADGFIPYERKLCVTLLLKSNSLYLFQKIENNISKFNLHIFF